MLNGTLNGTHANGQSRILGADGQPLTSSQAWGKRTQEYGEFAVPHVVTFSSLLGRAWRTYRINRADEAMKHGREEALAMKRDAYLQGLLQERKLAVANRPWRIEVDNERDPRQKQVKEGITRVIKDTWRLNRLRYYLHEGIWYGRYGSQLVYEFADIPLPNPSGGGHPYKQRALRVKMHQPVNGDKIDFKWDGTPLMLVHGSEGTQLPGTRTVITDKGRAVLLEGNLRQRFIVHSHEAVDADFFDADSASAVWGIGIRSTLFWLNWLRQEWLANIADWCERTGLGLRLWYYQGGNDKSKTAVTEAARAQSDKTNILIPRFATGGGQALEGVDYVDTASAGADLLLRLQQHVEEHIERYVIGQTLSSSSEGNGLGGTGVASLHADTKSNITKFDAGNETDTMTADLVPILTQHTYPWCDFPVRYAVDVDDSNKKERMEAVEKAFSFGVDFREDDVRALTGLDAPQEGERTLRQAQAEMQAMQPKPAMGPADGQEEGDGVPEGLEDDSKDAPDFSKGFHKPAEQPPTQTGHHPSTQQQFARMEHSLGRYASWDERKHPRDDAGRFKEKLSGMAHGDLRRVGGWLVRRLDDDKYRIDTDEGHVVGGAEKIERHIDRHKAKARLEGKAYTAAVKRGESSGEAPDILVDAERAKSEAERFHGLPHGTRVVSLADDTWGRLGTIERDKKAGRNRVKLDGEPGHVSEWVEPLDADLSWRDGKDDEKLSVSRETDAPAPLTLSDLRDDPKPAHASLFAELEQEVQRDLFGGDEPKVRQATLFQRQGDVGRYGKDEGNGRWITIGAEEGEDGKRHGGSPVYIENGRITKGAPSLVGRNIDSLEVPEEAPPELKGTKRQQAGQKAAKTRTENEREAGYQRAVWGKKARKEGIEPKHLHQLAADLLAHHGELSKDRAAMLKEARSALDEFGSKHRTIKLSRGKGGKGEIGDATEIPGLDQVAEWAAGKYPHLFIGGAADDQLFGMLSGDDGSGADGKEGWSEADAYEQAFEHLMEAKANPQPVAAGESWDDWEEPGVRGSTAEEDAVPFARTAQPQFAPANEEVIRYAREVEALRAQVANLTQPAKKRKRIFERDKAGRIVGITEIEG